MDSRLKDAGAARRDRAGRIVTSIAPLGPNRSVWIVLPPLDRSESSGDRVLSPTQEFPSAARAVTWPLRGRRPSPASLSCGLGRGVGVCPAADVDVAEGRGAVLLRGRRRRRRARLQRRAPGVDGGTVGGVAYVVPHRCSDRRQRGSDGRTANRTTRSPRVNWRN